MKYTAIIMVLLVMTVLVAGCGEKTVNTTTPITTTTTNTQPIEDATSEFIEENEEIDLGDVV